MAHVVLGCDRNNSNDKKVQNKVEEALKKQGHKVEKLPIGPNDFASYSYGLKGKNPKGKIGVYIIADGIFSIADLTWGNTGFKYSYIIIRGDLGRLKNRKQFESKPIGADADCTAICNKIKGKTYPQMNKMVKKKCQIVFGTTGKEMADELIKAMGGSTSSGSSEGGLTKKVSQGGAIKEALQKLLTHWDGQVECYIRGREVHVNKIRNPDKYHVGILQEGVNIFTDSVTVTDVNPNTTNYLEVRWKGGTITLKDDNLIKRFGVVRTNVLADNVNQKTETEIKKKSSKKSSSSSKKKSS